MKKNCIDLGASIRDELLTELVCRIGASAPEVRPTSVISESDVISARFQRPTEAGREQPSDSSHRLRPCRPTVIRRALTLAPEETFGLSCFVREFRAALANCLLTFRGTILDAGTAKHLREKGFELRLIGLALSRDSLAVEFALLDLIDYLADAEASAEG